MIDSWDVFVELKAILTDFGVVWPMTYGSLDEEIVKLLTSNFNAEYDAGFESGYSQACLDYDV